MSWSEPGFGFFGKGFWGRRVLWDNVPVQQRTLDPDRQLERFLGVCGDEMEAFLAAIGVLPTQRDPFLARAADPGEWFYLTSALAWTDEARGAVVRLIGEADYTAMPNTGNTTLTFGAFGYVGCIPSDVGKSVEGAVTGNTGVLVSYDNSARTWEVRPDTDADLFALAETVAVTGGGTGIGGMSAPAPAPWPSAYPTDPGRYPWYPYAPISSIARWWRAIIPGVVDATGAEDPAEYEVALVRTRNFDQPAIYDAARSLGNEVWVQGGDLVLPFTHPAGWIVTGDVPTDTAAIGAGVPIGLGDGTQTPTVALPGPGYRLQAGGGKVSSARLVVDVPLQGGGSVRLYDAPSPAPPDEVGQLFREDPLFPGNLDLGNPMGTVDYLAGTLAIDFSLNALGYYALFDGAILAYWQARGIYLQFRPPRVIDYLARDYGFDNDRNDPEERQRTAIAHVWQYFGCKAAQESYRIRGEISLFNVIVNALWRICTADLALLLPPDRVYLYDGVYYTDLAPQSLRFDDIRADEQYYDIFNHETPFPAPPEWLSLADRALMFEDDAFSDGMSVGLAFALDVTQGYRCPVSETNPAWRTPATVESSTPLNAAEAAAYSIPAGHRVVVRMQRCQAEAFNFHRGYFGLTEYDQVGLVRPAIDDDVFWIDYEEVVWTFDAAGPTPEEDTGLWTVIIGVGLDPYGVPLPGPTVGSDVAVRYWPEIDKGDCCFCRSYRVRVEVEPKAEAYAYYETEAAMLEAVDRLKGKLLGKLVPIHVRVAEWVVTTEWTVFMGGVRTGWTDTRIFDADEFLDLGPSGKVELAIEQRGDLTLPGQNHSFVLDCGVTPILIGPSFTGASDPTTWYPVAGYDPAAPADITATIAGTTPVRAHATATGLVTYGDVRWTFRVTRGTLG